MRDLKDELEPLESLRPADRWHDVLEREPRHLAPEPRRSRTPVFVFAAAALAVIVGIAISLSPLGGHRGKTAASGDEPPAWLVDKAYELAYTSGDITPTSAEWTFGPMDEIGPAVGVPNGDPSVREYLVVLHGEFTDYEASVPIRADLPTGSIVAFAVDPSTREVTDAGVTSQEVAVPGLQRFELPPASARFAATDEGWSVVVPPGWHASSFTTDGGPNPTTGSVIANTVHLAFGGGSDGVTPQVTADGFPSDGIALVIAPTGESTAPSGTVVEPSLSIDDFSGSAHQRNVGDGSTLDAVLFAHDGEIFIATLRTGDQVSDMDRAAIASVLSSFGFDDQPSPSAATVAVPDVIGMRLPDAEAALHEVGLEPRAETRTVDDVAEGLIASQDPAASSQVEPGSIVDLVVSGGPTVIGSGGSSHQIVSVGPLPQTGIVVSTPDGSTLLDTDGNVLATLPRFHLVGNPGAPGVWLESGLQYYALDPAAGRLDEVSRSTARSHMYDEGPEPDLAPPPGTTVGHWRYQLFPSVGTASLAQWSGECETPTAYWIDADGSEHIVTGERDLSAAPESVAIGWTPDGQALVFLPHGACGGSASQPGVYRYPAPGVGELVYPTGNDADAEMWDTP